MTSLIHVEPEIISYRTKNQAAKIISQGLLLPITILQMKNISLITKLLVGLNYICRTGGQRHEKYLQELVGSRGMPLLPKEDTI